MQSPVAEHSRKPRIHWHIFMSHFPVSLFAVCGGFQLLHLFVLPPCLEVGSAVCLAGAAVTLIPTVLTGRSTWKGEYHGAAVPLFSRKRNISYAMLALSVLTLLFWVVVLKQLEVHEWTRDHWLYFSGTALLFVGAVLEGYYGSSLHHR